MQFNLSPSNAIVVIIIDEPILSEVLMRDLTEKVLHFIEQGRAKFILDMSNLKFMNSAGVGAFVSCLLKARRKGGDFVLVNIPEFIMSLLGITHLIPVFTIANSIEEGKATFQGQKV